MKVHSKTGPGYPGVVYSRCLSVELNRVGLRYEKEKNPNVYCDEFIVGGRKVDFMVEEKVIVQLKTPAALSHKAFVRFLSHPKSHRREMALLLNFDTKRLRFKSIINNRNSNPPANPTGVISGRQAAYNPVNPCLAGRLLKNQENPWSNPDNPISNSGHPWSNPWL